MNFRSLGFGSFFVALASLAPAQQVYMSGLANPRGLTFAPDGTLYVAEAGAGGGANGPSFTGPGGTGTLGATGGVSTRLGSGVQARLLSSLPSIAKADGTEATGPADVGFAANGALAVLFGLGGSPTQRAAVGAGGALLGTLATYATPTSTAQVVADYAAREQSENPDGTTEINSNPYGLARSGAGFVVSDSGANALWRDGGFTLMGQQSVLGPGGGTYAQDSVPTGVVARPGGGFTVASLGGFPFTVGQSRIFSIGANGTLLSESKYGLTSITDLAYAPDGSLIVSEFSATGLLAPSAGDVKRIQPDGTVDMLFGGLITPTALAFGPDGFLYVTNNATSGTDGQVLRFAYTPVPEPGTWAALGLGAFALLRRRRH